ncbi:MAG: PDZ domain-containing protein [Nitrospirae bacterium]|nr:PDZ domain-containing protein [Candidatus Troglogloeales bacterium]
MKIIRDKKEKEVFVTLSEQPKEVAEKGEEKEAESGSFGISVQDVTPDMAEQFNLDPKEKGVIVVQIEEGSLAEEAGLREGDLIIEINRKPVLDLKSYERLFTKIKKGEAVLILINRQGSRFYLTLTKDMG